MNREIFIKYNNNFEKIIKFVSESDLRFNKRLELIKIFEKNNIKWKEANKLSKIWYNIKFNKCKYNQDLYNEYIKYNNLLEQLNNS